MKPYIITLDTGTTNTRATLFDRSGTFIREEKCRAGVRDTAVDGNNLRLKEKIRDCLESLVHSSGISFHEVDRVFASGMITSNVGVLEVPHLTAPAAKKDFAKSVVEAELPELCPVPICFIRGLKNSIMDWKNLGKMDIMRGEEVEALALLERCPEARPCVLILPGSHTKFVFVDESGRLTGCLTSLTGELLEALTERTILADAVERRFVTPDTYRKEAVLTGFHAAKEQGFGRAAFLTRIYRMFGGEAWGDPDWAAGFLLGAVLWNDAAALRAACRDQADTDRAVGIVAGKEPFLSGLTDVLTEDGFLKEIRRMETGSGPSLSALGAFAVAKERECYG